ncbi:glycoside hydrolase family 79 protein [Leucogyrophana mollusca]|uniref:Glycoside hydrolase family 79 protein n=1 Tax=Leucogyrophana mollusca TaxID=85980 RepID=A0ACB8B9V9_9AGAM|nr:glycoside hydrolase family 79 protein [Leucogyrophana mollusca]
MLPAVTLFWVLWLPILVRASVTVYSQIPLGDSTATAAGANYTGAAAYDPTVLQPPPVPSGLPTQFSIQLQGSTSAVSGLSIQQRGSFLGYSIEFSVIDQVLGINSSFLQVPFLNLMANIRERAGEVHIRVGGNTQETATLVENLPGGVMMAKETGDTGDVTQTPALLYTAEVLNLLGNISALVDVKWFLGIPFNDTNNLRLGIAEVGEAVLSGPGYLLGFQVGNEPDLYAAHGNRPSTYSPYDYFGEFGVVVEAIAKDTSIPVRDNLVAPSVSGTWSPEMVWNTGFISSYSSSLGYLAVEHYPSDNCYAEYGTGTPVDPQTAFPSYLNHNAGIDIIAPYLNSTAIAQQVGKPFMMLETNTASCGGFPGISDSFGATLWALDYGLQMASSNFSGAMLHVGGQDVYYNPFTPPPTNQSSYHQWTIGAIYYSTLVVAEAFGSSGTAQIIDLNVSSGNIYTPGYAIYDNGGPARLVLMNYVTDPSGASDITATFSIGGGDTGQANGTPAQVQVKYLQAPSVSEKYNITWAGQTFGANFESDGRLQGTLSINTVSCDQSTNTCSVTVPAPGAALVFLTSAAFSASNPSSTETFPTTALTKTDNTATINPSVLATSNGMSGSTWQLGSTSQESRGLKMRDSVSARVAMVVVSVVSMILW